MIRGLDVGTHQLVIPGGGEYVDAPPVLDNVTTMIVQPRYPGEPAASKCLPPGAIAIHRDCAVDPTTGRQLERCAPQPRRHRTRRSTGG
jgi:hypothetical protein